MKRLSYLMMASLMALGFGACSDEVDVPKGGEELSGNVYMSFDLKLPTSRSTTDADGTTNSDENPDFEVGKEDENKVSAIKVVLATSTDGKSFTHLAESKQPEDGASLVGSGTNYTVTFQSSDFEGKAGTENVYAFVICNPTLDSYANLFVENGETATVQDNDLELKESIAKSGAFVMTNAKLTKVGNIPDVAVLKKDHGTIGNPFDLGTVYVERTAARFDYKSAKEDNKYTMLEDESGKPLVQVELTDMALINMSKNYYWLRRVASTSATPSPLYGDYYDAQNISICGVETMNSGQYEEGKVPEGLTPFVVDTDAATKLDGSATAVNFHYYYWAGNGLSSNLDWTSMTYFSNAESDNWKNNEYKIWRYATENTLPSVNSQLNKYSTGVVFKGKIIEPDDVKDIKLNGTNNVYVFNDVLYGNWEQVMNAAKATNSDGSLVDAVLNNAYKILTKEGETEPEMIDAVKVGFTVYAPNKDGDYEVYYYYWNRHNDNEDNNSMGIMEFAVVRNNVYKLSVTNISKFGHPADPTGDPDKPKPDDPDEDDDVYFRVGVEVLPWVVRVNNIEF